MFEQYVDKNIDFFPNGKLFRIIFDNISCKFRLLARNNSDLEKIVKDFSVENTSSFFVKQHGYSAESKLYIINKFGFFSVGLFFEVLQWIKLHFGTINCVAISNNVNSFLEDFLMPLKTFAKRHNRETFEISNISKKYELRDYQKEIIKSIIFDGFGKGLFESPTGSGKSFVIANFIYTLQQQYDASLKFLIFVPNRQLVEQFYTDLLDYGFKQEIITRFTAGLKKNNAFNKDAKIIIANRQYIFKNLNKLPKIDCLIADECHSISYGSSTFEFVENLNAKFKIGCSGTIPRDKYQKFNLIGLFSKIIYTEDIVNLQNRGFISQLKINIINIIDKEVNENKNLLFNIDSTQKYVEGGNIGFNDSYDAEIEYIGKNYRKLYTPVLNEINKLNGNVLVLFDRIEFGKNMYSYSNETKIRNSEHFYIDGSTKVEDRENIRKLLEQSNNNILFAESAVFSTGINIRNLNNIVFMFSGKSFYRICQAIGRTLRLHKDKEYAQLIDVVFSFKYSRKHFKERMKIYREMYNKYKPDNLIKIEI